MARKRPELKPLKLDIPGPSDLLFRLGPEVEQDGTAVRGIGHNELRRALERAVGWEVLLRAIYVGGVQPVSSRKDVNGPRTHQLILLGLREGNNCPMPEVYVDETGVPVVTPELRVRLEHATKMHQARETRHRLTRRENTVTARPRDMKPRTLADEEGGHDCSSR